MTFKKKHTAANVIQECWYVYKFTKLNSNKSNARNHQRKLINQIEK